MNRRNFVGNLIKGFGSVSLASSLAQLYSTPVFAQQAAGYKALVCLFLDGGLDCNSAVVPMDSNYAHYAAPRQNLAYPLSSLCPLQGTPNQPTFGLHPNLQNTASLFNSGQAAILANVGTIARPTAKTDIGYANELPADLYSHPSQIASWEMALARQVSSTGWAGRAADALLASNGSGKMPAVVSTAGYHLVGEGNNTNQISASDGNSSIELINTVISLQQYFTAAENGSNCNSLQQYLSDQQRRSLASSKVINDTFAAGTLQTAFPTSGIGQQLQLITKLIAGRAAHDTQRQIFVARDASYDSHSNQSQMLSDRLGPLDTAIAAFVTALKEIGMYDKVILFTCSDFGRTLQQNAQGGSDHAWGGHQFIIGGSVKGGRMYGTFPTLQVGGPDDQATFGNWIPTTGTTQYLATMANWLGVPASSLPIIFPELANFSAPTLAML